MKGNETQADTRIDVLDVTFKFLPDGSTAPDRPGILVVLDHVPKGFAVLGVRPSPSLVADAYCEGLNPEWEARAEGEVRFAWCPDPAGDENLSMAITCEIMKAWVAAYRRGERLWAEGLA